jgi:hypothetical protein
VVTSVSRRQWALLAAILVVASAIRLWGLSWGLPNYWSGDEVNKRDASLGPHFPELSAPQPGFLYNALWVIYRIASVVAPNISGPDQIYLGRLLMAVIGVLTVLAVWLLARELSDDDTWPSVAVPAAALLAVLPLHTEISRFIKEDAPVALMAVLVLLTVVRYAKDPTWLRVALLGLAYGACVSTKFTGAVFGPVVAAVIIVSIIRRRAGWGRFFGEVAAVTAAAIVGLYLVSPEYLVDPGALRNAVEFQFFYSERGHADGIAISPWSQWWTYYIRHGLIPGMTWPVFLVTLFGTVPLLRRPSGWAVVAGALLTYLVMEHSPAKPAPFPARYLAPMVPLLCVQAGFGIQAILRRSATVVTPAVGAIACAALFVVPPAVKSVMIVDDAVHDTRLVAGRWMDAHIPAGARVVKVDDAAYLPASDGWKNRWQVEDRHASLNADASGKPVPYFVVSSFGYQRYLDSPEAIPARTAYYRTLMHYRLVKSFEPRWLTYGKHSPVIKIYRPTSP